MSDFLKELLSDTPKPNDPLNKWRNQSRIKPAIGESLLVLAAVITFVVMWFSK